jgi:NAD(P)-dependent dehydrogenase (short-subunit alcohol dehydrogenase family)
LGSDTVEAFGGIDCLVNNAAIYGGMQIESLMKVDLDYYRRFMAVNMDGAFIVTRACFASMRTRPGAAIVNQSSTAAWMAGGFYSIAKAGINSLTVNLAAELAHHDIRVNAIAPGPTDTSATREVVPEMFLEPIVQSLMIKRMGTPDDHVGALLFLLSDEARWMTGQIVAVDGGQIVRI